MTDRRPLIRRIVAEHGKLTVDETALDDTTSLYSVGLTSHASVNLMLALEDEFDVEFPERLLKRSTFESILQLSEALDSLLGTD